MISSITKFSHLQIPFKDISSATNEFADSNLIGRGEFGKVYKGRLWWGEEWIDICARRLDRKYGLGDMEFWAEISMLSSLKHRCLISNIGFCDENNEKIIVNRPEAKGSLQEYLSGSTLSWMQRLKICVDVAHALKYLNNSSVIHHNINTSTILLDENWKPKLSGFEFSLKNPSIRDDRVLLSEVGGTIGYVDPEYEETRGVTYKTDVFSLGVVLFEILCGRKAYTSNSDHNRFLVPLVISYYDNNQMHEIVHPDLQKSMDPQSLLIFSQTAYNCLNEQRAKRPDVDTIVSRLEKVYNLQWKHEQLEQSTTAVQLAPSNYREDKHLEHLKMQLKDILSATKHFDDRYLITWLQRNNVYKAKLEYFYNDYHGMTKRITEVAIKRMDHRQQDDQVKKSFFTEIQMLSRYKHRNIISLLGFCVEDSELILVYELASKGCIKDYLDSGNKKRKSNLPWGLRLKICLDLAHGLNYLHANTEVKQRMIHGNIFSANILLSDKCEAKISGFGHSIIIPSSQQADSALDPDDDSEYPEYLRPRKLRKHIDIYCFGVVFFELLCGKVAYDERSRRSFLPKLRERFNKGRLREMVDPMLKKELGLNFFDLNKRSAGNSLDTLIKVAYQCLEGRQLEYPTMEVIIKALERALCFQENFAISLEEIRFATQNFNHENYIGSGGFGMVYKGELQRASRRNTIVAKRLKSSHSQGKYQFLTERQILLEYKHGSIIDLVGYCDQMDENILVYELMSHGSLDGHLKNVILTWTKRLQICIDVAKGLHFLHQGGETQEVVIHRDIKSANILLNDDWKAKISDFGLSLICSINKETNFVVNRGCGTPAYWDPLYIESGLLTRESDIYSFGVVMFEILSGRLAYEKEGDERITMLAKRKFQEGKIDDLVFEGIKDQISPLSLIYFQTVAYQCLYNEREKRPTTSAVLKQLNKALKFPSLEVSPDYIAMITNHYSSKILSGYGKSARMYIGELEHANGYTTNVVVKDYKGYFGPLLYEFCIERHILEKYKHENLIGLIGYSVENTKLIVEHMPNGGLHQHLKNTSLKWKKRLQICIDVARGLEFLHAGGVTQEVVIHNHISSDNILLDGDWKAKISDFGTCFIRSLNLETGLLYYTRSTNSLDFEKSHIELDIYSLGKVLFEILTGRLAGKHLFRLVKRKFKYGMFDEIVFEGIKEQIAPESLATFGTIAYQCLREKGNTRPRVREVLLKLKEALAIQENHDERLL